MTVALTVNSSLRWSADFLHDAEHVPGYPSGRVHSVIFKAISGPSPPYVNTHEAGRNPLNLFMPSSRVVALDDCAVMNNAEERDTGLSVSAVVHFIRDKRSAHPFFGRRRQLRTCDSGVFVATRWPNHVERANVRDALGSGEKVILQPIFCVVIIPDMIKE